MKEHLRSFFVDAKKIAILAIGNPLRGDDAAGIIVGERLREGTMADIYIAEGAPENFIMNIVDRGYTHVLIIDSAIREGVPPGSIFIVDPDRLSDNIVTTHSIPMKLMVEILRDHGIKTLIIGIQPKNIDLVEGVSPEVLDAIDSLVKLLMSVLSVR